MTMCFHVPSLKADVMFCYVKGTRYQMPLHNTLRGGSADGCSLQRLLLSQDRCGQGVHLCLMKGKFTSLVGALHTFCVVRFAVLWVTTAACRFGSAAWVCGGCHLPGATHTLQSWGCVIVFACQLVPL